VSAGEPDESARTDALRPVTWPYRTAGYPEYERPDHLRPRAPDDNPEFLAKLKKDNSDHERLLRTWEDDLRRREEQLRDGDGSGSSADR
jgi:hypothetical protein